ncbi:MAG: imidazole glycerol phosphate synthase subunit HisH, partial [Anaerovorax sp.]
MLAIVDYGVGNLYSLRSSLRYLGIEAIVTGKPEDLLAADKIILPGVGAFGDAAERLRAAELSGILKEE